jgi:hypothetical protein
LKIAIHAPASDNAIQLKRNSVAASGSDALDGTDIRRNVALSGRVVAPGAHDAIRLHGDRMATTDSSLRKRTNAHGNIDHA